MEKTLRADLFKSVYGVETTKEILEVFRAGRLSRYKKHRGNKIREPTKSH